MITRKTVLALGAGASTPFGFPTSRGLLMNICQGLGVDSELQRTLLALGNSEGGLEEFRQALDGSMQPSVEYFCLTGDAGTPVLPTHLVGQ